MARDYYIQGEGLVTVKGASDSPIANLSQLGLPSGPIVWTPDFRHRDISPDAWGNEIPNDVQWMLGSIAISMNLIHFDKTILDYCMQLSMGQPQGQGLLPGQIGRAGQRLGGGNARFAAGWKFISVTITGPVSGIPYRFLNCYMTGPPVSFPLGTEKSVVQVNWRALPYAVDPYGGGTGAQGVYLYDNTADT